MRNKHVGENINKLMQLNNINISELHRRTPNKMAVGAISKLINHPQEANLTMSKLQDLATALKVPAWTILIEDFPFERKTTTKIHNLVSLMTNLNNRELEKIEAHINEVKMHNQIKEQLSKYEPQNPLLKA